MSGCGEPLTPQTPNQPGETDPVRSKATDWDWSDTLRSFQGNAGLLKIVMETYLEEVPSLQQRIRDAIDRNDAPALKIAAHSLKGAFRYLGIAAAFEQAFRLEKMGEMKNLTEAREILPTIEDQIAWVSSVVADYLKRTK